MLQIAVTASMQRGSQKGGCNQLVTTSGGCEHLLSTSGGVISYFLLLGVLYVQDFWEMISWYLLLEAVIR